MKPAYCALLAALTVGCFAVHEPQQISRVLPRARIPLAIAAEYESRKIDPNLSADVRQILKEIDETVELSFIEDLRATQVFQSVDSAETLKSAPSLRAIRLREKVDPESYCGEITIAPAILTAGLFPARDCHRAYQIRFVDTKTGASIEFKDRYSADIWFGWIPVLMNFRTDWHWYGPRDDDLRIAYLRRDLLHSREHIMRLATPNAE